MLMKVNEDKDGRASGRVLSDIQALRGLATLLVFLHHLSLTWLIVGAFPKITSPFYLGVDLFFVISGYVVTRSIFEGAGSNPVVFFSRRLFRLWPALFFVFGIAALVSFAALSIDPSGFGGKTIHVSASKSVADSFSILVGTWTIGPGRPNFVYSHMWSLSVEFQFYAALTLALCLTRNRAVFLAVASALYVAAVAHRLFILFFDKPMIEALAYFINWRFDFLLLGMIGYLAGWRVRLRHPGIAMLLVAIPIIALAFCEPAASGYRRYLDGAGFLVAQACFLILVLAAAEGSVFTRQNGWTAAVLLWVGDRSYSAYILQFVGLAIAYLLIFSFVPLLMFKGEPVYSITQAAFAIPIILGLSALCYRWVEVPGQRIGKHVTGRGKLASVPR